jgi:AcrR family transcriptional regulator
MTQTNDLSCVAADFKYGETFDSLLAATLRLMDTKDVKNITFREIALAAGVSHMTPYRYFKDRDAIFSAIAEVGHEMLTREINSAIEKYPLDPRKQFLQVGMNYYHFALANPKIVEVMFGVRALTKPLTPGLLKLKEKTGAAILRLVRNCQLKGVLPTARKGEELASLSWSLVHGFTILKMSEPTIMAKLKFEATLEKGLEALLDGLSREKQ